MTYTLIDTHVYYMLGTVVGAEPSGCSRGYIAQDFLISAKKNRTCGQLEQVHHVDGPACMQIVAKYI